MYGYLHVTYVSLQWSKLKHVESWDLKHVMMCECHGLMHVWCMCWVSCIFWCVQCIMLSECACNVNIQRKWSSANSWSPVTSLSCSSYFILAIPCTPTWSPIPACMHGLYYPVLCVSGIKCLMWSRCNKTAHKMHARLGTQLYSTRLELYGRVRLHVMCPYWRSCSV